MIRRLASREIERAVNQKINKMIADILVPGLVMDGVACTSARQVYRNELGNFCLRAIAHQNDLVG
jgi:hypothetical protein